MYHLRAIFYHYEFHYNYIIRYESIRIYGWGRISLLSTSELASFSLMVYLCKIGF